MNLSLEKVEIEDPHIQNNFDKIQSAFSEMNPINIVSHSVQFNESGTYKVRHNFKGTPSYVGFTAQEGSGTVKIRNKTAKYIEMEVLLTDPSLVLEFLVGNLGLPMTEVGYELL